MVLGSFICVFSSFYLSILKSVIVHLDYKLFGPGTLINCHIYSLLITDIYRRHIVLVGGASSGVDKVTRSQGLNTVDSGGLLEEMEHNSHKYVIDLKLNILRFS